MKVEISNAAADDLADIWSYGAERFGSELADAYGAEFETAFALIGKFPLIGPVHEVIRPPIHSFPHGSHRIFYDVLADHVMIQRVLHKAMDADQAR